MGCIISIILVVGDLVTVAIVGIILGIVGGIVLITALILDLVLDIRCFWPSYRRKRRERKAARSSTANDPTIMLLREDMRISNTPSCHPVAVTVTAMPPDWAIRIEH
ncbi:uncharacterized protein EDB91DRAFT_1083928 [Suillus paluster]|uniref:uncharacterized protein n=1 Tax=Suillus paluster TaxID=48578 RepID=UPI001B87E5D2|nr:uncharacterized protein EDB91DRAFT_1083928 [Suillus paluster]KAG1734922.1 hypothetical protein EDB91DRAFT_1083928 [Suillus paluster]